MPWKETCAVMERERLVRAWLTGRYSVSELAREFEVSRKSAYKWLARHTLEGLPGLMDRPCVARHHPTAVPQAVVEAVVRAKRAHPLWGPLKLQPLPDEPAEIGQSWPAPSTRGAILARAGLTSSRRRRRHVPPNTMPFRDCLEPNDLWCGDFKGWFRTGDGARCNPLTITDAHGRALLRCQAVDHEDYFHTRPVFESAFREFGLPKAIRTDNGAPFASLAAGGLSKLSVWWVKLGIWPDRIDPGHPEQNGRHERMHLTLKLECCRPAAPSLAAQQLRFDAFRDVFNNQRPHQALGLTPPASVYRLSPRPYPSRITDPVYPQGFIERRVRSNGEIRWHGNLVFISTVLPGEAVGICEGDLGYEVYFGPVPLGRINVKGEKLVRLQPFSRKPGSVTHARS